VLFCPALRPERILRFPSTGCDVGIADLEDGVAPSGKADARQACREVALALATDAPGFPFYVRVNKAGSDWFDADIEALIDLPLAGVVLPKVEDPDLIADTRRRLEDGGRREVAIMAGIETAFAIAELDRILPARGAGSASPPKSVPLPDSVYFGAEDLIADIGGVRTRAGLEVLYARSSVALRARVAGIPCVDQVVVRLDDDEQFVEDAAMARSLGYHGKLCLHPRQVPLANRCFSPSPEQAAQARRLVEAYEQAASTGAGVVKVDGEMVDEPRVINARAVLAQLDDDPDLESAYDSR
jgi:citrate lyase subunit beta/citryl-CoA lyase